MNGDVRRSTPAMRNKQVSPMLIVTTGAGGWLLGVLVKPEPRAGCVEIRDHRVRFELGARPMTRTCR